MYVEHIIKTNQKVQNSHNFENYSKFKTMGPRIPCHIIKRLFFLVNIVKYDGKESLKMPATVISA